MNDLKNSEEAANASEMILRAASECGFDMAGISGLELPESEIQNYIDWLNKKHYGTMNYLRDGLEIRMTPQLLLPDALSVISAGLVYKSGDNADPGPLCGRISEYAYGRDYHKVLKKKLKMLAGKIQEMFPQMESRGFVDSAPVFEKLYGQNAGLGTKGKNSLLINAETGSKFFIGELITNLPLKPTERTNFDPCKSCRLCVDKCPTGAILEDRQINASKCIAYLTIEYRGIIPEEYCRVIGNRIFGCDECQDCCPWNRRRVITGEADFTRRYRETDLELKTLLAMTEEQYLKMFEGSVIRRAGWVCFMRNVIIAAGNSGDPSLKKLIEKFTSDNNEILRAHARRAMEKLQ